jgi:hypothetical protein
MSDVFVYYFIGWDGTAGENTRSWRAATLEAIKGRGEPIMESQMVVDHSELDGSGFLIASVGHSSFAVTGLMAQIKSLELRAASRDREAAADSSVDERDTYMLLLESRVLREQARKLKLELSELIENEIDASRGAPYQPRSGSNRAD